VQISNQFKYISNEFPLTIIFIGIGLRQRGLYSDGNLRRRDPWPERPRITQLAFREFSVAMTRAARSGDSCSWPVEKRIVLARKHRGMLIDLSGLPVGAHHRADRSVDHADQSWLPASRAHRHEFIDHDCSNGYRWTPPREPGHGDPDRHRAESLTTRPTRRRQAPRSGPERQ